MSSNTIPRALLSGVCLAAISAPMPAAAHQVWTTSADHVLGTAFNMAVTAPNETQAQFAFTAAHAEISRLDRVLSAWRADSELSVLNEADVHNASADLYAVIAATEAWRARTDGAYDARLGLVEAAWQGASAMPDTASLAAIADAAKAPVGLDPATRVIERPQGVRFAPDGLAKGYIIDTAMSAARRASPCTSGMMIDIGGDVRCFGVDAAGQPWRIGIAAPGDLADNAAPAAVVTLNNAALAVSGPGARDREGGGVSHLIDPATGQPAQRSQVAVIAAKAVDADAAATALAVMRPADVIAAAERLPGVEAMVFAPGGRTVATTGWGQFVADCQAALPAGFAVEVQYNIPKFDVANYRKPYTIVWVTDANKTLVKTLLLTGSKAQYQESNYVWWRRFGRQNPDAVATMAKPTQAPGKHSVSWDGTDQSGARVASGAYTVHIETAREHGGHAYQAIPVTLGAKPVTAAAPAADELGASQVLYAKP